MTAAGARRHKQCLPAVIGQRIKALRQLRGWSLQQVADLSSCTKSHVWELEQGSGTNPTINMLMNLSQAFGVAISDLIGEPTHKPRVRSDLAPAISAVNELWQRAWNAGFEAGRKAQVIDTEAAGISS